MDFDSGWNYRIRPVISYDFTPVTADGAALGTAALPWSDLDLASGGVISWDNDNVYIEHGSGYLNVQNGSFNILYTNSGFRAFSVTNYADASSVPIAQFEGDRSSPSANDSAYIRLRLSDSAGNQDEFVRIGWRAIDVTSTSEDGEFYLGVISAGSLVECFRVGVNYVELDERTAPSAPAANKVRIFCQDNGAGKTQLMALFPSGAAQQIAIEP